MPDGDWTDDRARREIRAQERCNRRAQERYSRRPEDFQTLIQAEPVPAPFVWDTKASRAFLKALMEEQEAMAAWTAKPWSPFGENTTLKQMQAKEKQQEVLRSAWEAARAKRAAAMEALADEMREEAERKLER